MNAKVMDLTPILKNGSKNTNIIGKQGLGATQVRRMELERAVLIQELMKANEDKNELKNRLHSIGKENEILRFKVEELLESRQNLESNVLDKI